MPRKPINYSKTHFYKLVCKDTNITDCYVGHTTDFTKRKHQHKTRCCNPLNPKHHYKLYQFVRDNGNWDNWEMVLIETRECENNLEARRIERELTEQIKPSLNIIKSFTSDEERKDYQKQWYLDNKDDVGYKHKIYREEHAEEMKQDRKNNPSKYKEIDRKAYLNRPAKYFEQQKTKIVCECGGKTTVSNKAVHFKTKKHQDYLKSVIH